MRFLRHSLVGLFLLSVTAGLLAGRALWFTARFRPAGRRRPCPGARERVFAVNVVTVRGRRSPRFWSLSARCAAVARWNCGASRRGRSSARGRVRGRRQGRGRAILVRIDPQDAQSALDIARTDLAEAEAEQRDAERSLELARDELTAAETQELLRDQALARQQNLSSRGVGTDAAVETAELAASASSQAVLSRRQALAQPKPGSIRAGHRWSAPDRAGRGGAAARRYRDLCRFSGRLPM